MTRAPALLVSLAVIAIAAVGAVPALAAPGSGAAIRAGLPGPERELPQAGSVQFVGQDSSKTFNVAIVRGARGAVLAYVCNGTDTGRWLTGVVEDGVAELTGRRGASLRVTFAGKRVAGSARIGAKRLTFNLPKAIRASGLFRVVEKRIEAASIVANTGVTRGLASEDGGKTVATSSSSSSPTGPDAGVEVPPNAAPEPTILRKFRCSRLVLAHNREQNDILNGRPPSGPNLDEITDRFVALGCSDFFVL